MITTVSNTDERNRAQEVLNEIERYDDHILTWVGAGPYTIKGTTG